ncbi:hypothetical protein EBR21_16440 [bacterium]|nr:hypothetical protein [bacterium]
MKFCLVFAFAVFASACGRQGKSKSPEPAATPIATPAAETTYKAVCVVPGELPDECLAYQLIPVSPQTKSN